MKGGKLWFEDRVEKGFTKMHWGKAAAERSSMRTSAWSAQGLDFIHSRTWTHTQTPVANSSIYLLLFEGLTPALLAMWGCYKIHKNSTNRGSGNGITSICIREKKLFCDNEVAPSNKKSKTIIVTYKITLNNFYLKLMNHTSKSFRNIYE